MGKHGRRLLALTGTFLGGSYMVGTKVYDALIATKVRTKTPEADAWLKEQHARRDIYIDAIDGTRLHAAFLPAGEEEKKGRTYCFLLHDTGETLEQASPYAAHYSALGMDVLLAEMRGHGKSAGKYKGYGYDDRLDVLTWLHWILKRDAEARIILHGLGNGAAAILMALPEHMPTAVYCVVADSSYTTLSAYLLRLLKYGDNSRIPARIRLFILRMTTRIRAGYDIKDADVMAAVARAQTPVIFVQGDSDKKVPVEMGRQLYARAQCTRQISIHLGAGHLESMRLNPARYWEAIDAFLEKHSPDRL
ncbi:MAG: alpha/beta hydrolase [Lachnospiraceae bacterium]|nr:alpha/beta hydrolase [Lachnospiraceae bacterium]